MTPTGGSAAWTITPNSGYKTDGATFSPAGCGTINGNTVTISNVTGPHTCTVTLQSSDPLKSFTYTGDYAIKKASDYNLDTSNGDYTVLALLSDGELTFSTSFNADIFMVGGGGGGAQTFYAGGGAAGGGGGGGGYVSTKTNITLTDTLAVTIGAGGGSNSAGGATSIVHGETTYSVNGGGGGNRASGGTGSTNGGSRYVTGGSSSANIAFGETTGIKFAGGGGGCNAAGGDYGGGKGGSSYSVGSNGIDNTGAGGGGGGDAGGTTYPLGGSGGSGIILIRVHQ